MTKSLKDIVEDGFSRLARLSEKRRELLLCCSELADGVDGVQCKQSLDRLSEAENTYDEEIGSYALRSQEVMQQALSQIVADNENFIADVSENLQQSIARMMKELHNARVWLLSVAGDNLHSSCSLLEREMEGKADDLRLEALKLLNQLEILRKHNQAYLQEAQAEIGAKLVSNEHELTGSLAERYRNFSQEFERCRQQEAGSIEKLYHDQTVQTTSLTGEVEKRISAVLVKQIEKVKSLGNHAEKSLDKTGERILADASASMTDVCRQSVCGVEETFESSRQKLSDSLFDLRRQADEIVQQLGESFSELETNCNKNSDSFLDQLRTRPSAAAFDMDALSGPVDETVEQFGQELDICASDFKRQLKELLKLQQERLSSLCSQAESSISTTVSALNTERRQMIKTYEEVWNERDQELVGRLRQLEKEAQETCGLANMSAFTDKSSDN